MTDKEYTVPLINHEDTLVRDPKLIEDYTKEADVLIENVKLKSSEDATVDILVLEKKARQGCDSATVIRLVVYLFERYKDENKWEEINELLILLCKKRGQLKRTIVAMVRLLMGWIDNTPCELTRNHLVKALTTVTQDKMFVEVEKARLLKIQADTLEAQGNIEQAAELLQDVLVETFGGMEQREKFTYILNQLRLVLACGNFIRCQLMSKKISSKILDQDEFQDLKLQYNEYMITYYLHEKDFLNTAKIYWSSFNTKIAQESDQWKPFLENYVVYLIMAPYSEEASKLLKQLSEEQEKRLKQLPLILFLTKSILSTQLVPWPLTCEDQVKQLTPFQHQDFFEYFRAGFIQHNVLILTRYYKRISMIRAAELLSISIPELEDVITKAVIDDVLYARIDRPSKEISFEKPLDTEKKLDLWSEDVSKLLDLIHETSHLISNERMIQASLQKRKELHEKTKAQ